MHVSLLQRPHPPAAQWSVLWNAEAQNSIITVVGNVCPYHITVVINRRFALHPFDVCFLAVWEVFLSIDEGPSPAPLRMSHASDR